MLTVMSCCAAFSGGAATAGAQAFRSILGFPGGLVTACSALPVIGKVPPVVTFDLFPTSCLTHFTH